MLRAVVKLDRCVRKRRALHDLQWKASDAQLRGNLGTACATLRTISGAGRRTLRSLCKDDGSLTTSTSECEKAWTHHVARVHAGVMSESYCTMTLDSSNLHLVPHDQHTFRPSADEVETALWLINGKKALGPTRWMAPRSAPEARLLQASSTCLLNLSSNVITSLPTGAAARPSTSTKESTTRPE